jgi:hypothetical protein
VNVLTLAALAQVFPHFDPLWVRLDGLDHAPDGSSKKAYSSRMLDRLTQAGQLVFLGVGKTTDFMVIHGDLTNKMGI